MPSLTSTAIMFTASWLRARRSRRYLFLALCSPILLPFLCATFPLLCVAELCLRFCCRRKSPSEAQDDDASARLRRCEEGGGGGGEAEREGEVSILQRYLEDQLLLVGSVYECGDDEDDDGDVEFFDSKSPLLG
ncbi:hypothetical protein L1049_026885 [Liquidambar formosana]|uniref:Uncharacterized protein n=1 Tax=Liquidambar formosana TaxID=63359 RepID=A0AAP0NGB5_LIQFO